MKQQSTTPKNDPLNSRARERLNFLFEIYELCQKGGNFSLTKVIKKYKIDPHAGVKAIKDMGVIDNGGKQTNPVWIWQGSKPNAGHVHTMMKIETDLRRQKYEQDKERSKLSEPETKAARNDKDHVDLSSLSSDELIDRLRRQLRERGIRGQITLEI
jgi:hypothetical protein